MTKRLLASFVSVLVTATVMCAVPVSAEIPDNLGTDYEPSYNVSEFTGNLINTGWTPEANKSSKVNLATSTVSTEGGYRLMAMSELGNPLDSGSGVLNYQGTPLYGTNVGFTNPTTATTGNVVFTFQVKTNSTNVDYGQQKIQMARRRNGLETTNTAGQEYPVEYPGVDQGMLLTTEYQTFCGTFAQVDEVKSSSYGAYSLGLPMGTKNGARAFFKTEGAYIGYEYPYDMAVSVSNSRLSAGDSIVVDADILNQIGKDGNFNDSATWYALNADRTAEAEGFVIVNGEDGKATVTADASVANGKYYLVAVSDVNSDFVKGIEVEVVKSAFADYEPGEIKGNIIGAWTVESNSSAAVQVWRDRSDWSELGIGDGNWAGIMVKADAGTITVPGDKGDGTYDWQVAPLYGSSATLIDNHNATGNVVFSFDVISDSGSFVGTKINLGRRNNSAGQTEAGYEYPVEYPTWSDGFVVPTKTVATFTGTFIDPEPTRTDNYAAYTLGFSNGTVANHRYIVNKSTAYIGYEYAHDINVSANTNVWNNTTNAIVVKAELKNQLGNAFGGTTDLAWKAMNQDRTAEISGINITDNGDGTANVIVDNFTVAAGSYDIVAYSPEYNMAKGVTIAVEESDFITDIELSDFSGSIVTATAKLLNKTTTPVNAVMVVIMVNSKNQVEYMETLPVLNLTSADGVQTYTKTLTAADLSNVVKAKAFLLDCGSETVPTLYNSTLKQLAPSVTKAK